MTERWTSETTIKFIQEVKSCECLYSTKLPLYRLKHLRDSAWKNVVESMGIEQFGVVENKKKMKNFGSTYYQEKSKIVKSQATGAGSGQVYVPNIKWFTESDSLLNDDTERRTTINNKRHLHLQSSASQSNNNSKKCSDAADGDDRKDDPNFECNICLDTARDAVVSMCGHLFCWPCLHQWLETRPTRQVCPVCKAAVSKEKVVPLYGRGTAKEEDPRDKIPPRPAGQRTEPETATSFLGFGESGFHMSFGIGAFPFGFFSSTFNFGDARPSAAPHGTQQHLEEQYLSKLFLWLAILFILWLLLA
ncbi:hypothetical protein FQA39_LY02603 [Lamprigera yunnana]|nr:hypothetical protein FQA39_LY02603 [Lamprigera yunnana]